MSDTLQAVINGHLYTRANFEGDNYADTAPGTGFLPALCDIAAHVATAWLGTSGSSLAVSLGPKTLTVAGNGFAVGQPVLIAHTAAPTTNQMFGVITAWNAETGTMQVEVDEIRGAGVYTLWTISVVRSKTLVATSPVPIADGGTAATTAAAALRNLDGARAYYVVAERSAPLGTEQPGDRVLVAFVDGLDPSNPFVGHVGQIATTNGTSWTFITPTVGDLLFNVETTTWRFRSATTWLDITEAGRPATTRMVQVTTSTTWTPAPGAPSWHGTRVLVNATSGPLVQTLPAGPTNGMRLTFTKTDGTANTVTLVGAFGVLIDGQVNRVLTTRYQTVVAEWWSDPNNLSSPPAGWITIP